MGQPFPCEEEIPFGRPMLLVLEKALVFEKASLSRRCIWPNGMAVRYSFFTVLSGSPFFVISCAND